MLQQLLYKQYIDINASAAPVHLILQLKLKNKEYRAINASAAPAAPLLQLLLQLILKIKNI